MLSINNLTTSTTGKALDAAQGKALNDRLIGVEDAIDTINNSELLVIGTEIEDSDITPPISEINDEIETGSVSSTWSSSKIIDYVNSLVANYLSR